MKFWENIKEKFSHWGVYVGIGALVVYVVKMIWGADWSEQIDGLLNVLCPVLVAFGIINNPNSADTI